MDEQLFLTIASGFFGIFVGFVFRYFLERFEEYDVKRLIAVLAVPVSATLLAFLKDFGPNSLPAYTMGLVFGLVVYQAAYAKIGLPFRRRPTGLVTRTEVSDVVTILDNTGKSAAWIRTQKMKFIRNAKEVLISKTGGSGKVVPVKLTSPGRVVEHEMRRGYVYARFNDEIKKGETVEIRLESDINDSLLTALEWFEHQVLQNTDKLSIEIRFPDNRRCTAASLMKVFGADEEPVEKLDPGSVIRTTVPVEMHVGEAYRMSWNW